MSCLSQLYHSRQLLSAAPGKYNWYHLAEKTQIKPDRLFMEVSLNVLNTSTEKSTLETLIFFPSSQKNPIKFHETGDTLVSGRSADPFGSCI